MWPSNSAGGRPPALRLLAAAAITALVAIFALVVVRSAWVSDDAFITLRTIDNFLHGYGLRWNVAERVQSYTHPLWLFVLVPIVWTTGNAYLSAIGAGLVLTACAVGLTLAGTRERGWLAVFVLVAMIGSKSFTDYATSGLENPLAHVLLAALMWLTAARAETPRRAAVVGLVVCAISLTRLDMTLLAWPIGLAALTAPRRTLPAFLLGQLPLAAWEIFSVIYYGVPFPNTAYAKLATGVPQHDLYLQGIVYFTDSLTRDPVTIFVIAAAVFAGLAERRRATVAPTLAIALYCLYLVRIGGDFMTGRFLSGPFVVALWTLMRVRWPAAPAAQIAPAAIALVLSLAAPKPTIFNDSSYRTSWEQDMMSPRGVVDERGYYFPSNGWLTDNGFRSGPEVTALLEKIAEAEAEHPHAFPHGQVGTAGFYTGPDRYIIDTYALCDPLLARLPAAPGWRIGHFTRELPAGYWESIDAGANLVEDPQVHALYDVVRAVTRGPIWSVARWNAIIALNLGRTRAPAE